MALAVAGGCGREHILFARQSATDPGELQVSFTNTSREAVDQMVTERGIRYEIDGRSAERRVLFALSCLGGCPEIAPRETVTFAVPLKQLAYAQPADSADAVIGPGRHLVTLTAVGATRAEVWVRFPG